jgi:hypothetical protein
MSIDYNSKDLRALRDLLLQVIASAEKMPGTRARDGAGADSGTRSSVLSTTMSWPPVL